MNEPAAELGPLGDHFASVEGFLVWEEAQEGRHEFIAGLVWAMPAGTCSTARSSPRSSA